MVAREGGRFRAIFTWHFMAGCGWEADTLFPRHPSESWDRWRSVDLLEKVTPFRVALFNLLDL
ncbi:hypothetical protein, partial [Erythrobacter sanguineus]|uniref:hypothetical protein n=1 Tax=Erythrobacter sanguineus TaxID=198312 RepID=UPI001C4A0850